MWGQLLLASADIAEKATVDGSWAALGSIANTSIGAGLLYLVGRVARWAMKEIPPLVKTALDTHHSDVKALKESIDKLVMNQAKSIDKLCETFKEDQTESRKQTKEEQDKCWDAHVAHSNRLQALEMRQETILEVLYKNTRREDT